MLDVVETRLLAMERVSLLFERFVLIKLVKKNNLMLTFFLVYSMCILVYDIVET